MHAKYGQHLHLADFIDCSVLLKCKEVLCTFRPKTFTCLFSVISQGQLIPGGEEVQSVLSLLFSVSNLIVFNSPPFLPKANSWLSASYSPAALLFQAACLNFLEESTFFQSDFKRELSSGHGCVTKDYFFP